MHTRLRTLLSVVAVSAAAAMAAVTFTATARALDNGLGATPPLGWSTWNTFGCSISDALVRQAADTIVSSGMAAAGYQYVNIDDCWSTMARDSSGNLVPDPAKFPNGMKALADYVHSVGLKFGMYAEAGTTTCAGFPGSLGYETKDANAFASWGVDYLKYDDCGDHQGLTDVQRYTTMRDALLATGRPIFYNLCNWGNETVWSWGASVGNSWRNTSDISANWGSVMNLLDQQVGKESYSGPGGWNDPDMLEVGNSGLTDTESQAHFSLWSLLNAPLIAGNDPRSMTATTRSTLTNAEVLAVDQDWGGKQGYRFRDDGDQEVWVKPMADRTKVAILLLNRGASAATISVSATDAGVGTAGTYSVRDLWTHATTQQTSATVSATVPSHGATMVIVTGGTASATASASASTSRSASASASSSASASVSRSTSASAPVSASASASTSASASQSASGPVSCKVGYAVNQWSGGFVANVTVTNTGTSTIPSWTLAFSLPGDGKITSGWNAAITQTGQGVTATNMVYNGTIATGGYASFGFQATSTSATATPAAFTLNGTACAIA